MPPQYYIRFHRAFSLAFFGAVCAVALLVVACPSPTLQDFTDLPPVAVHSPETARRPYWFLSATGGTYRYVVYPAGSVPSEPVWVEFDVMDPAQCPVYSDADTLIILGFEPAGPARVVSPARVYFLPPDDFSPMNGTSWNVLVERQTSAGWERLLTRPVTVVQATPATPSLQTLQSAPAPDPRPSWTWTGPEVAVSYACFLYLAEGDSIVGEPVESALVSARLPTDGSAGTLGGFRPTAPLDPAIGWEYILTVYSVDAAGNRSTALSIPKLVIPALNDLKPVLAAEDNGVGLEPNAQGAVVTVSPIPAWTWRGTDRELKFRYQLREGTSTSLLDNTRWVERSIAESHRIFRAGTDVPWLGAAPSALGQGFWTLYVQAYFITLGDWADTGHLTIEVTGNPPPDPVFSAADGMRTKDTTPTWLWSVAAGTGAAEVERVTGYQYALEAGPRTPPDPEEPAPASSGVINPVVAGSVFSFTPGFELADGSVTLRVWTLDARGVRSRQSAQLMVVVDTSIPKLLAVNSLIDGQAIAIKAGDPAFPLELPPQLPVDVTFELVFSKAMNPETVEAAITLLQDTSVPVPFLVNSDSSGLRYTIVPSDTLNQGRLFSLSIATSASDRAENALATGSTRSFSSGILAKTVSSEVVPDPNLRGAFARSAAAYALAHATNADLVYLHQLLSIENDSSGSASMAVSDLTGLQYCTSAHTLQLYHDKTGLSRIDLAGQSSLSLLPSLQSLTLEGYLSLAISLLPDSLSNLNLAGSAVTDSSALQSLSKLLYLDLKNTDISDFSFLALPAGNPALKALLTLDLSGTTLGNTGKAQLAGLTALRYLNLATTGITGDLANLQNLIKLEHLDLSDNQLTSLAGLGSSMSSLQSLAAKGNDLDGSIGPILGLLSGLEYLYLCENRFASLPDMSALTNLKVARFADQQSALLAGPVVVRGQFDDQDPLDAKSFLDLSGNGITALDFGTVTFLGEVLDLSGNALTSTTWAAKTLKLRELDLSGNSALGADAQLSANLQQIPNLNYLNLSGCGVTAAVILELMDKWPSATIVSP